MQQQHVEEAKTRPAGMREETEKDEGTTMKLESLEELEKSSIILIILLLFSCQQFLLYLDVNIYK